MVGGGMSAARARLIGAAAAVLVALALSPAARATESFEAAVKATYLVKLAAFVTWPPNASPPQTFVICVVGADPFGSLLDRAAAGQQVFGRLIQVRRMPVIKRDSACDIAFLSGSKAQSIREGLRELFGDAVLTVTDSAESPGVIDFVVDQGHVLFRIDRTAAADNDLVLSSKLFGLAASVRSKTSGGLTP